MSERTKRNTASLMNTKHKACELITYFYDHHSKKYLSAEKEHIYDFALKEAYREVLLGRDTPLNILDCLLVKYDSWAHTDCSNDADFSIMARAVEDLIDMLINS